MVVATAARICRSIYFCCLLHVGGVSGQKLFLWKLPLAVLFAGTVWRFATQLVRAEACVVADRAHLLPSASNSLGAGRVPAHLLLLSRRLLQRLLGGPTSVHCRGAAQELLGR